MKVIFYLIRFSGWKFFLAAGLSVIAGACGSLAIKNINSAIHNGISEFLEFILLVGSCLLAFTILSLIATQMLQKIIQNVIEHLSLDIGEKLLKTPFEIIENKKDQLFTILTYDIYTISSIIEKVPNLFVALAVVTGCVIYLLFLSVQLSALIVAILLLVFIVLMITNRQLTFLSNKGRILYDSYVNKTNALIFGMRELYQNKAHRDQFLHSEYKGIINEKKENTIRQRVAIQFSDKLTESLALTGLVAILVFTLYFTPEKRETFSEIFTLSLFIVGPLTNITNFAKNLKPFNSSIGQIESLGLDLSQKMKDDSKNLKGLNPPLLFNNIYYSYPEKEDGQFHIGPLNIEFKASSITFITGGNGSGKTTFGKIVSGLYQPQEGQIKCNEVVLDKDDHQEYRNLFSTIWNDNFTFDNIQYTNWNKEIGNELLEKTFLEKKTRLTEGKFSNTKLSSGQLKRLALVTSILEGKSIYLFDEWAANQDIEFKEYFYREVLPFLKKEGKVVIVISHDKEYFSLGDQVLELKSGKLERALI